MDKLTAPIGDTARIIYSVKLKLHKRDRSNINREHRAKALLTETKKGHIHDDEKRQIVHQLVRFFVLYT